MFYTDDNRCLGCSIVDVCDFPAVLEGTMCPCTICLVKVMCDGGQFCSEFAKYEDVIHEAKKSEHD